MTVDIDNLVHRQAEILADMDGLNGAELESLANSTLPEAASSAGDKARRLLRGLARSRNVGSGNLSVVSAGIDTPIVPALPGFFVISLMPLSDGSCDREHVRREPVVGWRFNKHNYAVPVIAGHPVSDRWAVLTPEGFVIPDQFAYPFGEVTLALEDWIKSEIEWLENVFGYDDPTAHVLNMVGQSLKPSGQYRSRSLWAPRVE